MEVGVGKWGGYAAPLPPLLRFAGPCCSCAPPTPSRPGTPAPPSHLLCKFRRFRPAARSLPPAGPVRCTSIACPARRACASAPCCRVSSAGGAHRSRLYAGPSRSASETPSACSCARYVRSLVAEDRRHFLSFEAEERSDETFTYVYLPPHERRGSRRFVMRADSMELFCL